MSTAPRPALRLSPLDAQHRALGARMAEFGGWDMPLQYAGVLEEHRRCRTDAVVFDVSHLGSLRVTGPGAVAALQWALTNDLRRIGPGRAQYSHLLDPLDGHVVDDVIVWWLDEADLLVMPNASNTAPAVSALAEAADRGAAGTTVEDVTGQRAVLAVQGPHARARLQGVLPDAAGVARFSVRRLEVGGAPAWAAGTGYTGEDGVELHLGTPAAPGVWRDLLAAGVAPAGLGARDTLRLEAGLPLHGHELGPGITPLQAGLDWVVRFDKGPFRGREALEAERARGVTRRLRGLVLRDRQVPRAGCAVSAEGRPVGMVTSGNFSPTLGRGIALAFLVPDVGPGATVTVDIRGRVASAEVVTPPFVRSAAGARG